MNGRLKDVMTRLRAKKADLWWRFTKRMMDYWVTKHEEAYTLAFWTKTSVKERTQDPQSRYWREITKR